MPPTARSAVVSASGPPPGSASPRLAPKRSAVDARMRARRVRSGYGHEWDDAEITSHSEAVWPSSALQFFRRSAASGQRSGSTSHATFASRMRETHGASVDRRYEAAERRVCASSSFVTPEFARKTTAAPSPLAATARSSSSIRGARARSARSWSVPWAERTAMSVSASSTRSKGAHACSRVVTLAGCSRSASTNSE